MTVSVTVTGGGQVDVAGTVMGGIGVVWALWLGDGEEVPGTTLGFGEVAGTSDGFDIVLDTTI